MNGAAGEPVVLAVGVVDERGIAGTAGATVAWRDLGVPAPGTARTLRQVFGRADQTFRRLDRQTRAIVLAAEAAGVSRVLSADERRDAALATETVVGSIEVDLRYTRSLSGGVVEAAIFPYTLQSTCVGDVALRHGLRGPTVCLSIEPDGRGEAVREARRMLAAGAVRHAVVATVDALVEPVPTMQPLLRAVVAVLAAPDVEPPPGVRPPVSGWAAAADPFAALAAGLPREARP